MLAYCAYDQEVGYVQGMNMIVGTLLYHIKNPEMSFWALVDMMEVWELRMIYLDGFEHLKIHCKNVMEIVHLHVNDLYHHMVCNF